MYAPGILFAANKQRLEGIRMKEIRGHVESILRGYPAMKKELGVLRFELARITSSLHPEVIMNETFARSGNERVAGSRPGDKTADIVVEHIDSQRNSVYHALSALIHNNQIELQRLEYYLSLLPEDEAEVVKLFYCDGLSWEEIIKSASCSFSTLRRKKKKGVDKLSYYYSILDSFSPDNLNLKTRLRFIGYIHEERFTGCLQRAGVSTPGTEALLFIISGCNELWAAGVETFFNFDEGEPVICAERNLTFSDNGVHMLRLAYHLAKGIERNNLVSELWYCCAGLEHVNLELAIEAIKLALSPESR